MKKLFGWVLTLTLAITPALAAKVTINYDHDADFSKYHEFQYKESAKTNSDDPLIHDRVVEKIKERLVAAGFEEVDTDPDLYVTYHVTTEDLQQFTAIDYGYGYGAGWGGRLGSGTATKSTYTDGTLIIDAWDAETQKLVWRGTSAQILKTNPEKLTAQIDEALDKIVKKWAKMKIKGL
jgi:hypothetical protein